jgi:hypothetical protein
LSFSQYSEQFTPSRPMSRIIATKVVVFDVVGKGVGTCEMLGDCVGANAPSEDDDCEADPPPAVFIKWTSTNAAATQTASAAV